MENFNGKTCFVTGGAHGIGRAIVTAFHRAGASVAFCDRDREAGEALCRELPGSFFRAVDVTDAEALEACMAQVYDRFGEIDILVNNVGMGFFSPLTETPLERFDAALATNLRPVFITSRQMAIRRNTPEGKKRYGRIINLASTRWQQSEPGTEGYAASKGGIVSLTHALAVSLSEYNITVNCISPGWIDTGHYPVSEADRLQHPSGRVGTPDDMGRTCLFLAAEKNDFINGQNIVVDGGMTKKMIYVE